MNQFYLRDDGIPANTLEVHNAQFDSTLFRRISTMQMSRYSSPGSLRAAPVKKECPRGYESFGIWPRSNYFERPAPYPIWDGVLSFRWDERLWYLDQRVRFLPEFSRYSNRGGDFYPSVNQCFISPEYRGDDTVAIRLSHTMPNFASYEARFGQTGEWVPCPGDFLLKLQAETNTVEIRPVNQWGVKGGASRITLVKKTSREK
jgi:hypothetical protein